MKPLLLLSILLFFQAITIAQSGTIKGIIEEENGPLPGASLLIKGTTTGTQTDFDGKYTLECQVGDIIIVNYVGYSSWEFEVTQDMMGITNEYIPVKKKAVQTVTNESFSKGIPKQNDSLYTAPILQKTAYGYNRKFGNSLYNIQDITLKNKLFTITSSDLRTAYEINLASFTGVENVANSTIYANKTFKNPLNTSHSLSAGLYEDNHKLIELNGSLRSFADFYNLTNNSKSHIGAKFQSRLDKWEIESYASAHWSKNNFANLNGFQNKILEKVATTNVLNVEELFTRLESQLQTSEYIAKASVSTYFTDWLDVSTMINTIISNRDELSNQDFITQNISLNLSKNWKNNTVQSKTELKTDFDLSDDIGIDTSTQFRATSTSLDFLGINRSSNTLFQNQDLSKFTTELSNTVTADFQDAIYLILSNNSFSSTLQNNHWFQPSATVTVIPTSLINNLRGEFLNYLSFSGRISNAIKDAPLWYGNYSHNSLTIDENKLLNFSNKFELFAHPNLELERTNGFEITSTVKLANNDISIDFGYYKNTNKNGVFPILENDRFNLSNVATTQTKGFDADMSAILLHGYDKDLDWRAGVTLSRKLTITTKLNNAQTAIPISGFSTVNGNLIEGEVAGIIVDRNGIIIGDPTPDYTLSHYQEFKTGRLKWQFSLDYQQGGNTWDARKKSLDISNQPDQAFIEDASFISLSNLQVSYEFSEIKNRQTSFFRSFKVAATLNNLLLWSRFEGASPYNNLFDTALGNNFQLYNTPNVSTIGFKINAKI